MLIPKYLVINIQSDSVEILEIGSTSETQYKKLDQGKDIRNGISLWIGKADAEGHVKFIAAQIYASSRLHPIISDLWLKKDIVPYFVSTDENKQEFIEISTAEFLRKRFDENNLVRINLTKFNEVDIAELVTIDDYKRITPQDEFAQLLKLAKNFEGKKMIFISATPQGGGVALMRHALIRLYRLLGVDAHWFVLYPSKEAFDITKMKFHNILQGVSTPDTILSKNDKKVYDKWIFENAEKLKVVYNDADAIIIDDPQPSGLIPYIKKSNPKAKIIYRSHIQIDANLANIKDTPQNITWQFIWNKIKDADLIVSHPLIEFIPKDVPTEKIVFMPATTDALDGLNKPLTPKQKDYYLDWFNVILLENAQTILDDSVPYIIQIARFDPSKGIPDVIEAYGLMREKLDGKDIIPPQLIICGHGSIDDPQGSLIYNETLDLFWSSKYKKFAKDIKIARLPASDQLLNALLSEAKIALQLSHKEGFEVKISEALMKGVPVIGYIAGGIPHQIKDGISGYLVDVGDIDTVANRLYELFTNSELYSVMSKNASENVNPETTTVSNAINWLFLANELVEKGILRGDGKTAKELINESQNK